MDPNETLKQIDRLALQRFNHQEAAEYCADLLEWLTKGGFQPKWDLYPRGEGFFLGWKSCLQ